jgi:hypothetical protein
MELEYGEIPEDRQKQLDKATDEFHLFACRMREVYGLDAVVILGCKDVEEGTEAICSRSGAIYTTRHMARLYSEEKYADMKMGREN